jgi:2-dehydro-3-deoxygalactonokinase
MLTSSLGFLEVPHVLAPTGVEKLSEHVRMERFPGVSSLPFFLVPGVRIRPAPCDLTTVARTDIIRGEETEIAGLLVGRLRQNRGKRWLFLHLGSHSKAIEVDARGRIVRSASTLAGESLHVLRTQTILANRLAHLNSPRLHERFFQSGARLGKRYGLLRALFMVRLLEENPAYHQAQLYSFLLGSLLASDLHAFQSLGLLKPGRARIVLSGQPDLQSAWRTILQGKGYDIEAVSPRERVQAFLTGLRQIVFASPPYRKFQEGRTVRA